MSSPTGVNWADAVKPLEASRQTRVVASFAEYLAEDVRGHPERALEAMASLAEWYVPTRLDEVSSRGEVAPMTRSHEWRSGRAFCAGVSKRIVVRVLPHRASDTGVTA
jgi:hypothetical protein